MYMFPNPSSKSINLGRRVDRPLQTQSPPTRKQCRAKLEQELSGVKGSESVVAGGPEGGHPPLPG